MNAENLSSDSQPGDSPAEKGTGDAQSQQVGSVASAPAAPRRRRYGRQMAVVFVLLVGCVVFTITTSDVTNVSKPGIKLVEVGRSFYPDTLLSWKPYTPALAETFQVTVPFLPEEIGRWRGQNVEMNPAEQAVLPADTGFARRYYTNDKKQQLYCSLVLEGKDVASIHRPQMCLAGQGWRLQTIPTLAVSVAGGDKGAVSISRLIGRKNTTTADGSVLGTQEMVFAYWFVGEDRVTPSHFWRVFVSTTDRLFRSRNHRWAYFLLAVPVMPPSDGQTIEQSEEQSMEVLKDFVSEVFPSVCNVSLKK